MSATRFPEIDLLRTVAIFLMVLYHAAYDLAFFYGTAIDLSATQWTILERITANLFLLLVGVSFAISYGRMERRKAARKEIIRKYLRRGIIILAGALLISMATYLFDPTTYVRFGVLHLIGIGVLLLPLLMRLREWNALLAIPVFLLGNPFSCLHSSSPLLLPFGITPSGFATVDYFPLFPWFSALLLGTALGNLLYNRGLLRWHLSSHPALRPLLLPGRYSLWIYLAHQPILLLTLWLLLGKAS